MLLRWARWGAAAVAVALASLLLAASPAAAAVPQPPTDLGAIPGDGAVLLGWVAPVDDGGSALTGYVVRRDGNDLVTLDPGTTAYLDDGLGNGVTYEYEVVAENGDGRSAASNVVQVTPRTVPSAPLGLQAMAGDTSVSISWAAPATDGGSAITGYHVYRDGVLVHTTDGATSWDDTGLINRFTYEYRVAATNLVGTGQRSTPASASPQYECPASEPAFEDVGEEHPFYSDVCWMDEQGISTGYADGTYRPGDAVSRQAMSAFMFRLADVGAFDPPEEATFSDVAPDHQFYAEVEWMAQQAITTGYADGTYRPSSPVSRAAMSAFLYRLAGNPPSPLPSEPSFSDVPAAHLFYDEIEWMAAQQISTGFADGTYRPSSPVSRQAMSAFMHRFADHPGVGV